MPASAGLWVTMTRVPAAWGGQASVIRATAMNAGQVLSIGVFFTLMIIGLAISLPAAMESHLIAQGLPQAVAAQVAGPVPAQLPRPDRKPGALAW